MLTHSQKNKFAEVNESKCRQTILVISERIVTAGKQKESQHHNECMDDLQMYTTHFLLVDRSNVYSPNILRQMPALKLHYSKCKTSKLELRQYTIIPTNYILRHRTTIEYNHIT